MGWQEIIVAIIGLIVFLIVANNIYNFFSDKKDKRNTSQCTGCRCGAKPVK